MFERFTDRARRVLVLAQEEARGLGHDFIGPEHMLLGLRAENRGIAPQAFDWASMTLTATREVGSLGLLFMRPLVETTEIEEAVSPSLRTYSVTSPRVRCVQTPRRSSSTGSLPVLGRSQPRRHQPQAESTGDAGDDPKSSPWSRTGFAR